MDKPTKLLWTDRSNFAAFPGGMTPVPNGLLDRVMPMLRDTELRVLLVVVRQTLGWQDGPDSAQRKEKDWLTQGQLMRRTGRASGAVSRAVDALVRAALIDVLDRAGNFLNTPAERRRHLGRLYYRLATSAEGGGSGSGLHKREHAKPNTTKESRNKNITARTHPGDKSVDNSRPKIIHEPVTIRTKGWERVQRKGYKGMWPTY